MKGYDFGFEVFTLEILANWRLGGVKAVFVQNDHGDLIIWPLMTYAPGQRYENGWAVDIDEREAYDAASGVDGVVFYVSKDKIVI